MTERLVTLDLAAWVAHAPAAQRNFRQAVHIVLTAIGASTALRSKMVMKGGMLMAIRYDSSRFTRDADFSTAERYVAGAEVALLQEFDDQLVLANEAYDYDTLCRRQSHEIRPQRPDANFPTLGLNIGYAPRSAPRELQRLNAGQAPTIVEIDFSFNEAVLDVEVMRLSDRHSLTAYSEINLIAEKIRSLLQQPVRQRTRRQDVYDLWLLLSSGRAWSAADRRELLNCLRATCQARHISATSASLADERVRDLAATGYGDLEPELEGPLPDFNEAYALVRAFYESLPWDLSGGVSP